MKIEKYKDIWASHQMRNYIQTSPEQMRAVARMCFRRRVGHIDLVFCDDGRLGGNIYEGYRVDSMVIQTNSDGTGSSIGLCATDNSARFSIDLADVRAINPGAGQDVYVREADFNEDLIYFVKRAIASAYEARFSTFSDSPAEQFLK
jgi:hypothetical protein